MGVASNGHCLPTAEAAAAYACGTAYPVASAGLAPDGSAVAVMVQCSGVTGTDLDLVRSRNGVSVTESLGFAGPTCDELEWLTFNPFGMSVADGALVGGAIASVWCAAVAWKYVTRTLKVGDGGDDE
jgi:hypothetical protein